MPKQGYYGKQVKKSRGQKPKPRKSDRHPTHKKPHPMSMKERTLRDWKRLGKDIEQL